MANDVPFTVKIRPSRVKNIETERLIGRQGVLVDMMTNQTALFEQRREMVNKAMELFAIENEMDDRGISYTRRTFTAEQSQAISTRSA